MVPCTLIVLHWIRHHWNRCDLEELKFRWNKNSIPNADRGNKHESQTLGVERCSNETKTRKRKTYKGANKPTKQRISIEY